MALRWIEGFETTSTSMVTLGRLYASATGQLDAETPGSGSDIAVYSDDAILTSKPLVGSVQNTWIIGITFRARGNTGVGGTANPYIALQNVGGEQIRFEFVDEAPASPKPGGYYYAIRAMRGATELARTNELFQVGDSGTTSLWVSFEFEVTIDNVVGSIAGRYFYPEKPTRGDSVSPVALTWDSAVSNIDTQNQVTTGADRFELSFDSSVPNRDCSVDNIYLADNTGSKNNSYIGKLTIEGQKPTGDGDTTDWDLDGGAVSTQDAWDENPTATDDDPRTSSDATNAVHLATVGALSTLTTGSIIGVRQDIVARMETTGDLDIAHMWRKTTATAAQTAAGSVNISTTAFAGSSSVLEDDPNTATDWDIADLDSYQHGVRNDG